MTDAAPVAAKKAKAPRVKPAHPPTNEMVHAAIKGLKERGGSSLIAIKKYIAANYKVDVEKLAPFIKRALKSGVVKGDLVQAKGKGASGSFKVASKDKPVKKASSPKKKVAAKPKQSPKKAAKKTTKKATPAKPKKSPKKAKKPTKAKKVTKSPAKKPKAPKAKKTPAKKPAAKKASAKK
jgi:histone H1/5